MLRSHKRFVTQSKPVAFRLRQLDIEALHGLAAHYRIGRSEVIRLLLTSEWAKIQTMGGNHDRNTRQ
ncbi:hypothetical protein ATHL_00748 [Anaerolinea thermolimosa]|uniref:hypothetical protein n=1 Tax=Anaerolinea thermolimosa TaxID=229919 RepID=UPI0013B3E3C9|nr:hypothetical protein [Anaerolinea thermolimosa]GAP05907.1 hypothetical protein ATHL_00748 [Anaerolinea thermolimosa]